MSVKFKLSTKATDQSIERVLEKLAQGGLKADPLFPGQSRPSLARMFVIRSPRARVAAVEKLLEDFEREVEYIEGAVTRKPLA